jgi:16S rRNA (cytosine967-C5)-methyltransferase
VARLSITHSHPEWIVSAYFDLLRDFDEVERALSVNNIPARPTLVSWPGKSTQEDLLELGALATEYSPYGAIFDGAPGSLEIVRHRKAGVQDEGSQIVADVFARVAKDKNNWLDLCAGPGGKAALLSSLAQQLNVAFTANEVSETRSHLVKQVVGGARVWTGDAREIAQRGETFDAILADVPCTGLGALRRRPEVRWRRSISDLRELTLLQRELAQAAIGVLDVGGIFGYATCSPHLAETRIAVGDILKENPQMEMISLEPYIPQNLTGAIDKGALALWTHRHGTDSMFLAMMRKTS